MASSSADLTADETFTEMEMLSFNGCAIVPESFFCYSQTLDTHTKPETA
jgi:hypothetical protein